MARINHFGAELNSANLDTTGALGVGVTIDSGTFRTGTYSYKVSPSANNCGIQYQYRSSTTAEKVILRVYVYLTVAPGTQTPIISFINTSAAKKVSIRINTDRTLQAYNEEDSANIGSASSAISLNTWTRLELSVDCTTIATTSVEALLNGVSFASGTINLATGLGVLLLGNYGGPNTTFTCYYDDIAINDSTGSFQNSYPGAGQYLVLRPNAVGDNSGFTPTAGANYTNVDEVTPNDAADTVSSSGTPTDDYNIDDTPAGIGASDTINVVSVYNRFNSDGISGTNNHKLRIKASAGGTLEESATIGNVTTPFVTHCINTPHVPQLILYNLPGASTTAWTKADLDTAQIGVRKNTANAVTLSVTSVYLMVDSTPAAAGGGGGGDPVMIPNLFWGSLK